MGKKVSDRRGKVVTGAKQKNDDFYRIRIVMLLYNVKQENKNQIKHNSKYGINPIEAGRLTNLLQKMVDDDWIEEVKESGVHYSLYKLSEKGLDVARYFQKLRNDDSSNFLFDFEYLTGIKRLDEEGD